MTILSKGNLAVERVAAVDDGPCAVTVDGATCGIGRKAAIVVTPVGRERREAVSRFLSEKSFKSGAVLGHKTLKEADRLVGRDSTFKGLLEHCDISDDGEGVFIRVTDGSREQVIRARQSGKSADVPAVVAEMLKIVRDPTTTRFVVNRKRLKAVLDAIDKACPDSSDASPVWIDSGPNGVVLRAENRATKQRAIALMPSGSAEGNAPLGLWERQVAGEESRANERRIRGGRKRKSR